MKVLRYTLAAIFIIGLFAAQPFTATAQSFPSYISGITVQNLSGADATVTISYYRGGTGAGQGELVSYTTDTIAAFKLKDYAAVPVTAPFTGSVVISSDKPVGVVSTLRGDNKGRGAYVGSSGGSTTAVLPFIMHNWGSSSWNTFFSVQNVGGGDATVQVDFASCLAAVDRSATIKPNAMVTFDQATESCMTTKTNTSAKITSNQPIVVVTSQESGVVNSALVSNGFTVGATNPVIPLVNVNNPTTTGWRTAISIYNMGSVPTNVVLTYKSTAIPPVVCTESKTIPANGVMAFAGNGFIVGDPNLTCAVGARFIGAAYVTTNSASVPLVATVNQDRVSLASAYGSFDPAVGTPKIAFPQIQDRNGAASQWASSFNVMNVGSTPTYIKCTFANTTRTKEFGQVGSYAVVEDLQRDQIAPSYVGSAECTAYSDATYTTIDASAKIVGVANVRGTGVGLYDLMMSYEALNTQP